jgi:Rrf2 family protein
MLKLSKKVDYGLMALMHLARETGTSSWSAREIAETYDIPGGLLAKILQKMGRKGLVVSQQGMHGGYTLARPADEIRAVEVVEAIEGPVSLAQCFATDGACLQFSKCHLKSPLQQLSDIVNEVLSQVTIAQLVEEEFRALAPDAVKGGGESRHLELLPVVE